MFQKKYFKFQFNSNSLFQIQDTYLYNIIILPIEIQQMLKKNKTFKKNLILKFQNLAKITDILQVKLSITHSKPCYPSTRVYMYRLV